MHKIKLKYLSVLLLSLYPIPSILAAPSPFPYAPLHLQSEVEITSATGAKPNVLLYIDDSGSMTATASRTRVIQFRSRSWPYQYTKYFPEYSEEYYRYRNDNQWLINHEKYPNRMDVTQSVLSKIVNQYQDKMRWAIYTMHNNGRANMPFPRNYDDPSNWQNALESIQKFKASGGTPSTSSFLQFTPDLMNALQYRCQKSYVIFMSDGDANGSRVNNHNLSTYFTDPKSFAQNPSGTVRYTIDYDSRNLNNLGQFTRILGQRDFKVAKHGLDRGGMSWDDEDFKEQTIDTYAIGFGTGISKNGEKFLRNSASSDDKYLTAEDDTKLIQAFDDIFTQVNNDNQVSDIQAHSVAAPALTANSIDGMAAAATLDTGSWASQLRFYQIDPKTDTVNTKQWQTPTFSQSRSILASTGQQYQLLQNLQLSNAFFGIENPNNSNEWKEALLPWIARSKTDQAINSWASRANSAITYREREEKDHQMGDIIDNPIIAYGNTSAQNKLSEYLITSTNDGMLYIFKNSEAQSASDNPYHLAFNYLPLAMQRQSKDNQDTVAKYYKNVASSNYGASRNENSHVFLMNGGISVRTTAPNQYNQKQSFLAANMGQGGRGMFVLNLSGNSLANQQAVGIETEKNNWPQTIPLFETSKGEANELGYTVSTPQLARVSVDRSNVDDITQENVRYATFLANGYNSPSKAESALYIYDALGADAGLAENSALNSQYQPGDVIRKITAPGSSKGLSTPLLLDTDLDGLIDIAYAGSLDGNVYRFDFRANNPSLWSVHTVYQGSPNQPIMAAPAASRLDKVDNKKVDGQYIITFGTGSDLYQDDLLNKTQQSFIGIYDDINQKSTVYGQSQLLEQTLTTTKVDGKEFRFASNHSLEPQHLGWFINLGTLNQQSSNGERVTTAPNMFMKTVVFSSRIYNNEVTESNSSNNHDLDVCKATTKTVKSDAQSWIMALNVLNGGALTSKDARIEFTANNTVVKDKEFFANGQKYSGLSNYSIIEANNHKSYTIDGTMRSVGEDDKLNQLTTKGFNQTNNSKIIINDTTGGFSIYKLKGAQNKATLKRKSWKELY